jgi:hypothetical protein
MASQSTNCESLVIFSALFGDLAIWALNCPSTDLLSVNICILGPGLCSMSRNAMYIAISSVPYECISPVFLPKHSSLGRSVTSH